MSWYTYIVRCADDSLYTGITRDLVRRTMEHNIDNHRGAKYLRSRRPVQLVYYEFYVTHAEAARWESLIKRRARKYKLALIESFSF